MYERERKRRKRERKRRRERRGRFVGLGRWEAKNVFT